jgi:ribosomal protein L40E
MGFWVIVILSGVVLVTVLLNLNGYMKRDLVAKRMLLLLAAFGSPTQISRPGGVRIVRKVVCIYCGADNESMATRCHQCGKVFPGARRKRYRRRGAL